jgi:hypothetical protein
VLDQFGAADRGYQEFARSAIRAFACMHRAVKLLFQKRVINLAQRRSALLVFNADHNPVGVKKIFHCRAFAQKFGIGSDLKFDFAVRRVSGKRLLKLHTSQRWDSALFDHEFWRARFRGDLAGDVINRGKIRFAGFFGRRADADENHLTGANGLAGVFGVTDLFFLDGPLKDLVEMLLVDGNLARLELGNAIFVDIRAEDFMTRRGETSAGHQPNVTTPDYRQTHVHVSFDVIRPSS